MELTGKCKEEFEKWFTDSDNHKGFDAEQIALDRRCRLNLFYQLYPSMRYGVLEDYFDSVGINIEITNDNKDIKTFWIDINAKEIDSVELNSRPEARIAAIEKANELRNEALNK